MPRLTRALRALLLMLLAGSVALAAQGAPPTGFTALYDLSRNGIPVGTTRLDLQINPDLSYSYQARSEASGMLALWRDDLIREESHGRIIDGRPRPDRYLYLRQSEDVERQLELSFDWRKTQVRIDNGSSHWWLDIGPQTLDKLVQQLVFVWELGADTKQASYRVADGGRLKDYQYRRVGRETVNTPQGRYQALRFDRGKNDGPPDYSLWLAAELQYRPVKIVRRHRAVRYEMLLRSLQRQY